MVKNMKKELQNIIIESKLNLFYFNKIIDYYNSCEKDILDFFRLDKFIKKYKIIIMSYDEFNNYIINKYGEIKPYTRGDTDKESRTIRILNLEDQINYTSHKDATLDDFLKMIIHEFVHACHDEVNADYYETIWFYEGIATNLSKQNYKIQDLTNCDFELLKKDWQNYKNNKYSYAYTIVNYIISNYTKDEVYKLICDSDYLRLNSDKLFNEALIFQKEK